MTSQSQRFTDYQKRLYKSLILLINLYYTLNDQQEKSDKSTTDIIHEHVAMILGEFFKSSCSYDKKFNIFLVSNRDSTGAITVRIVQDIGHTDIVHFKITMELLRKEILAERYVHFATYRVDDHISSYVLINEAAYTNRNVLIEGHHDDDAEVLYKASKKELETTVELITRNLSNLADESLSYAEAEDRNREIKIESIRYRIYQVEVLSVFGRRVAGAKRLLNELGHTITEVDHLESSNISSFRLLVRALLILFHIHFDGYHRIKTCKYSDCKRMFFEKKKGKKEFCGSTCRKRHLDLGEDDGKRKCRYRQNAWADRHFVGANRNDRSHCDNCLGPHVTKHCPIMLERNKDKPRAVKMKMKKHKF